MKTIKLPYAAGDAYRAVAKTPRIAFKNRLVEQNPVLTQNPVAAIARPAMRKFVEVGDGPIRSMYSASGLFDDSLFVVSGPNLYTLSVGGTVTFLGEISTNPLGDVSWAAVAGIGEVPSRLFFAEGGVLWVYSANGEARGQLQASGAIVNGDVVRIDDTYYQFTSGSVDSGTPAGTAGAPWLVDIGVTDAASLDNLRHAINDTGTAGTTYSTALTEHPTVLCNAVSAADLFVAAKTYGADGNTIVTTETGTNLSWGGGTLSGGGAPALRQVNMPNDVGAISVAHINSYVIVVPVQSEDLQTTGRFYWVNPGETVVDDLDFATAERASDNVNQVKVFGNKFWLPGATTVETWITTGDPDAPMQRFDSILYDRGSWEGTAVQVKDSLIIADEHGGVFRISGGLERISRPDIEERIRKAIQQQEVLS